MFLIVETPEPIRTINILGYIHSIMVCVFGLEPMKTDVLTVSR